MPTYSTIADLLNNNNRQPYATALVLGAASVGDGGGGIFVWHPVSTATPNGETVLNVPGVTLGRWLLIISNAASPTKDVGDLIVNNGTGLSRLPVGSNNQVLTADSERPLGMKWAAAGGGGDTFTKAVLAADFTKNNNTTLADVTGFAVPVAAGEKWFIQCNCYCVDFDVSNVKYTFTGPAGCTSVLISDSLMYGAAEAFGDPGGVVPPSSAGILTFMCMVQVGATPGTVQFQAAQDTPTVVNSIIKAGSMMIAQLVST